MTSVMVRMTQMLTIAIIVGVVPCLSAARAELRATVAHAQGPAYLVTDIKPGAGSFADLAGLLLFFQGPDLWKSDGTTAGTRLVAAVSPECAEFGEETTANGLLFLGFASGCYGGSLWRSDGTVAGTFQLLSYEGPYSGGPKNLVNLNDTLFFSAFSPTLGGTGYGIWKSDGTVAGTQLVIGIGETYPEVAVVNGKLFFTGSDSSSQQRGLWVTNGTAVGTRLVKEGSVEALTAANSKVFFTAVDDSGSRGLWVTDTTAAGPVLVTTPVPFVEDITTADGRLFFVSSGTLWTSDGTAPGTMALKVFAGIEELVPLTAVGRHVFFSANDEVHGYELWKSDGTAPGTVLVKDINPGGAGSNPSSLTGVRGTLFFSADDGSSGYEPWTSDGTEAGTLRVQDVAPGNASSDPMPFTASGSRVFFTANDGHGLALWALSLPATITVNSTADNTTAGDRKCTLREAIANVNAAADTTGGDCAPGTGRGDTIAFDLPLPATITLTTNSELAVNRDVTISGPPIGALMVDGNDATRIFDVTAGYASISNITVQNGRGQPGGIDVAGGASVRLTGCTVRGNNSDSEGGGVYIDLGGVATLDGCTVSGNASHYPGGGIANFGTLRLTNSTLSGNANNGYNGGSGLYSGEGMATLINCTVSNNSGAGIEGSPPMLTNTIVANNAGQDCRGAVVSLGHNLDSDGTCGLTAPGDLSHVDPKLGPLQDNGGPTFTQALLPGSPAIDEGDDATCAAPPVNGLDQLGMSRPSAGHRHCSVGAYEADAGVPAACAGDCDASGSVTVDEIIALVNIALGSGAPASCSLGLLGGVDASITLIIRAVNNALDGCAAVASTPTARPVTPTPTPPLSSACAGRADGSTCDAAIDAPQAKICSNGACVQCAPDSTAAPRFVDNGDGSITDRQTCLVWEKKDSAGGIHDLLGTYIWSTTGGTPAPNGVTVAVFLAALNSARFAGHGDWRLPTSAGSNDFPTGQAAEIESIADVNVPGCNLGGLCIAAPFNTNCGTNNEGNPGCTVDGVTTTPACSCTVDGCYWSATAVAGNSSYAWCFFPRGGFIGTQYRTNGGFVRAVRGGV